MTKVRPRNAFERARDSMLAFDVSWWEAIGTAFTEAVPGTQVSEPSYLSLGDDLEGLGRLIFERRTITLPKKGRDKQKRWTITRTTPVRFSMLPPELLEGIARDLLDQADAEWRRANIDHVINVARSFGEDAIEIAKLTLGADASPEAIEDYAHGLMPTELLEGGAAAERYFDESISMASIGMREDGSEGVLPEPPPPPGIQPINFGEWDLYSPEQIVEYDGPHSDPSYAFRVVKLCEALRNHPKRAIAISMLLGAVTREWEIWRENEEFLTVGRARFAEQSRHARSKAEKPWMAKVRQDVANDAIGPSIAAYARKLKRHHRDLAPPSVERIRNFVSAARRDAE